MGIKGLMSIAGYDWVGTVVLVIAFTAFCAVVIWALTRPKSTVERWAQIPLDEHQPVEERGAAAPKKDQRS